MQHQIIPHVHRLPDLQALQLAAGSEDVYGSQRRCPPAAHDVSRWPVERVEQRRRHMALHRMLSAENVSAERDR